MSRKGELHTLIKALTKAEKRYVTLLGTRHLIHGQNNCLVLLEAIDNQDTYNEAVLKAHFSGSSIGKNFAATKYDLHKLIFKALNAFHATSSKTAQIREHLNLVEILYKKGLYPACQKPLQRAKKIAEKHEMHLFLVAIRQWESRLLPLLSNFGIHAPSEAEQLERELEMIDLLQNETELKLLYSRIQTYSISKDIGTKKEVREKAEALMNNPLLENVDAAKSYQAKLHYYNAQISYHLNFGDLNHSVDLCLAEVQHMESNEGLKQVFLEEYITNLTKYILFKTEAGSFEGMFETIDKIHQSVKESGNRVSPALLVRANTRAWYLELLYYSRSGEFQAGADRIPAFEEMMARFEGKINPGFQIVFTYLIAYLLVGIGDYKAAYKWNMKGLQFARLNILPVFLTYHHLLNLILHLELGNLDLLPYAVRSTYRFLLKQDVLESFEQTLLRFIRKDLPKLVTESETIAAFSALRDQLTLVTLEPRQEQKLNNLDAIAWLESKIQQRSFAEIAKEKALKRMANPTPRH